VLRLGQDSGEVRMVFDVDGTEYEVTRKLQRKSGKVHQTDGYLKTPTETLNLSPSELKEKVLEVLEFNEAPDPKAQSWIYRYAVYTPQEEMKSILTLAPEQRLQILRRAFRVEDYKTAATNAEEATRQIREDARELDGIARGMDELRAQVERLQLEEEKRKKEMDDLEGAESGAEGEVRRLKAEKEDLQKQEVSLQGVKAEREYYDRLAAEAADDAAELEEEIKEIRKALAGVEEALGSEGTERAPTQLSLSELKRRERSLEGKERRLTELKAAAESKLSDYESIMKNGVCPVCDRPASATDFEDKKARKEAERNHVADELTSVVGEIEGLRAKIEETEVYSEGKKELALRRTERSKLKAEIEKKEAARHKFLKRSAFAKSTLEELGQKLEELKGVLDDVQATNKKLVQAEAKLRSTRDRLVNARGTLEAVQKRQTEIAIEIVAKEEASNKSRKLREREMWLEDYFVPTVRLIEKSVLATIDQEFDSLFKRWFGMLVTDPDKEVSVDEEFTPIISQGGYEQDVRHLSGGERTSVALAYRLALNILAQRVSVGMKSNLLILDEPTEGFSKEQLGSVREVLDEVECPQVIIVSHDKELESFADQIFHIDKTGTESAVRSH
jgi:DNA repair protein SbcC/Rad50